MRLAFRALLFMSGVFFEASRVPEEYRSYFYLNPLATSIEMFRDVLLYNRAPPAWGVMSISVLAAVSCALGLWMHWRYNRVFPRFLD
jgi:lipopolysaccharide transport system permease protein